MSDMMSLFCNISKASNFISYGDINIASNNNINVLGSMLASVNGNISLTATNDIKIEAGTNTLSQSSKQETIYGGGSIGNNGVQSNIGLSSGESNYNKTFYTNSQISAQNGNLTLTTGNDANISGANLLAKNTTLNIGNNLNIESKQTEEDYSSSGFGFNFGVSVGASGKGGNISGGFNMSNSDMHRLWVDDITTIKATDSMTVNVGKDLNLTGAAILSDNLALAVTGNINKKELQDSYYSESLGFGVSTSIAIGGNQATIPGTGGKPNQFPSGSTSISASYAQNESSRTVYATIGSLSDYDNGKLQLTSQTRQLINADFEGSLTLDHRLFSESGRNNIAKNFKELGQNLKTIREAADKSPLKIGAILNAPNTLLEGAIYSFNEPDSKLYFVNVVTNEVTEISRADLARNYAVNGIATDLNTIVENYLNNNPELVVRHNPTHGILGDLVESGLGKVARWTGNNDLIAMNRYVEGDLKDRMDLTGTINPLTGAVENAPINLFHSQGTIIGLGAMELYRRDYGSDVNNQIDNTQRFVAVGPAVLREDWGDAVSGLNLSPKDNAGYHHDNLDPVRYLTAPSNLINQTTNLFTTNNQNNQQNFNSPIYIPNLYDPIYGISLGLSDGLNVITNGYLYKSIGKNLPNIEHHDVRNPLYQEPLKLKSQ